MKRRWPWVAGAVAAVLLGIGAWLLWHRDVAGEIAEVVAEGGEKQLRDPMRPAPAAGPRVIVFALDGVGEDELRAVLRSGAMPHLAALVGRPAGDGGEFAHAYSVPGVLSILPSTTYAAWASVFTGQPAGRTGVPGNEWFAREEARFYAPAPVSVSGVEDAVSVYSDGLVGRVLGVPTLYEQAGVRAFVSLAAVHRGADLLVTPDLGALGDLAAAAARGVAADEPVDEEAYEELDRASVESLLASLRKHGAPALQVVYFPGVDLLTHVAEEPLASQREYLRTVTDSAIGRVLAEYRRQGVMDDTYVVVVADHGHTPVLSDDRHALETEGDDEPGALLRRLGFRVRPFELEAPEDARDYQAVLAYQGAVAYVYLADRSTCPRPGDRCDWRRPPRLEEDVLPVARAFYEAGRTGAGVPALRGTLDLVFAREPRAPGQDALPFRVWDGARLGPISDYLRTNPRPDLIRLEERLEGLATGPYGHRAGDVLLMARTGMERPIEERFYFSGEYHSWHGSATAQDSRIPLVVAHPRRTGAELRSLVGPILGERPDQLDVVPLIRLLLSQRR